MLHFPQRSTHLSPARERANRQRSVRVLVVRQRAEIQIRSRSQATTDSTVSTLGILVDTVQRIGRVSQLTCIGS
jgi:hypothetical protein